MYSSKTETLILCLKKFLKKKISNDFLGDENLKSNTLSILTPSYDPNPTGAFTLPLEGPVCKLWFMYPLVN